MRQRIRQFRGANQQPAPDDIAFVRAHLSPELAALCLTQHPRDVVHSVGTAQWLLERGHHDPDLVAAALLHDIGKGHQRRLDRVAWVLAQALRLDGVAPNAGSRFEVRRAMARSAEHSPEGARMLADAGATEAVVTLTRLHHGPSAGDPVLALLQQADAEN